MRATFFHVNECDIAPTVEVLHVAASDVKTGTRLKGRYAGNPAFGRVPDDIRLRIHELREERLGLERIAETLNLERVPTARGGRWTKGTIAAILKRAQPFAVITAAPAG